MPQVKKWRTLLEGLHTFIDWEVHKNGGDVEFFSINYCAEIDGKPVEICRYDTCHGFLHVHRFWKPLPEQSQDLEDPKNPFPSYREAFVRAASDLKKNWKAYRNSMK